MSQAKSKKRSTKQFPVHKVKIRANLCYLAKVIKGYFFFNDPPMVIQTSVAEQYESYRSYMRKLADVRSALAVMQWDQETYMPEKGSGFRAQQVATLSELAHEMATSEKLGSLLSGLGAAGELGEKERRNVALNLEDFEKQKKYSSAFVRRMSETISKSFNAWIDAKRENKFSLFAPHLSELVALKKEETVILGYKSHPYDALLDEYEKGCTVALLDQTFSGLAPRLRTLLERIASAPRVDDGFMYQHFDHQKQWAFGMELIGDLGFDTAAGRQDLSAHPFSTSFNPKDVRITTRINEDDFNSMTWSCIHETGHALYEQGLPESEYGLPSGEYASLGIHESQSRLWENHVGRSQAYWSNRYPRLQAGFPEHFGAVTLDNFYRGINVVRPSLIRTEADELTYHFHVMIRYEIEKKLITGDLAAADLPAFWNESYERLLGVTVPDDSRGCLQDVHWSHGSFGYFPTYSLGSFYAAQFYRQAVKDNPEIPNEMTVGETGNLLKWLRQHIHAQGRTYTSEELCQQATGEGLNISYFLEYLLDKYGRIYHL